MPTPRINSYAAALVLLLAANASNAVTCFRDAYGNLACPSGPGQCVTTRTGEVRCAQPGGGIALDQYGDARCGVGQCVIDRRGVVQCSSSSGGGAGYDASGAAICDAGCRPGSGTLCSLPQR